MAVSEEPEMVISEDEIAIDRCPTEPLQKQHPLSLEMDIGNPEGVASFLEAMAAAVRLKRKIKLIIE